MKSSIILNKEESLVNFSKLPPEGWAIVDGEDFKLILFKTRNGVVCLLGGGSSKLTDLNDKSRSKLWCYNYSYIFISNEKVTSDKRKFYDITDFNLNPYNLSRIKTESYSNIKREVTNRGEFLVTPVIRVGKVEVNFSIRRDVFTHFVNDCSLKVQILLSFLKYNVEFSHHYHDVFYSCLLNYIKLVWSITKRVCTPQKIIYLLKTIQ